VKLLYLLATLMFLGIFIIFICSAKVLNDLNTSPQIRINRMRGRPIERSMQPKTQVYVVGTYLGLTFFVVGGIGSILALFQSMRRF
jgi:hypothetical protein